MCPEKELTKEEVQQIGERFLLSRYPGARITFDKTTLLMNDPAPFYCLEGNIKMPRRNPLYCLFSTPEQYSFKVKVHATGGTVLDWELK